MTEKLWEKVKVEKRRNRMDDGMVTVRGGYNHMIISDDIAERAGWKGNIHVDVYRCGDEVMFKPSKEGDLLVVRNGKHLRISSAFVTRMLNSGNYRVVKFAARASGDAIIFNITPVKTIGSVQK